MPLAPLVLDDLDWAQLTEASRQRLPAHSNGQWTLHAPVDPGVTLMELFAWLLDQRIYWMDRVGEPLFRAAVELLGEAMLPVRPARTVMALERSGPLRQIPAGTTLEIARAETGPVFATTEGITLLDVRHIGLVVSGVDRENDLRAGRGVMVFPADGRAAEAEIVLYMPAPVSPAPRPFSLLLDLRTPPDLPPQWDPAAAAVDPPAEVTWWYSRGPGLPPRQYGGGEVADGTGGLRRAGVLRLPVRPDWAPQGPAVGGLLPYAIFARTSAATFTYPVKLLRIVPNVAIAAHRHLARESRRITGWLPLPNLTLDLSESSSPPIPGEVRVRMREVDGRWHRWRPVADFGRSGPGDRVFQVNRPRRRIEFGDGLTGRIPRLDTVSGLPNVRIAAMAGGGPEGSVGAGLAFTGDQAADVRGSTLAPAVGGREAETVDEARVRISGLLERVERAVTPQDHVTLAKGTRGVAVARAFAAVGYHPAHPCTPVPGAVTVFVVPWAPRGQAVENEDLVRAPMPDPGALAAVRAHLEQTRMVGTEVWVCPPRYREVRLAARLSGEPVDRRSARLAVEAALRRLLDPLEGGDDGTGWPFGQPIRPSALMREIAPVVEDAEIEAVAIGLDGQAPSEDCEEVALGPYDLPVLRDVSVTFVPDRRGRPGGLR